MNGEGGEVSVPQEVNLSVPKSPEIQKPGLDAILIFGQGPVVEKETRQKASEVAEHGVMEDINLWSKTLAEAASVLYNKGQTREIIIMGGKTGGAESVSEAELIAKVIESYGVPLSAIKIENRSTNTLENLVNVLNTYLDNGRQYKNLGFLSANYHIPRIRMLMSMFNIPYKTAFSAEEVMRYTAREGEDWDNQKLTEIERKLDMNEAAKNDTYYSNQLGAEKKNVLRRGLEEDFFSRALVEAPEYWLGYLGKIENQERVMKILAKQDSEMLKEFGIVLSEPYVKIKGGLNAIKRKVPPLDEWIGQRWSQDTEAKIDNLTTNNN